MAPTQDANEILQGLVGASLEQVCFGQDGVQLHLSGQGHIGLTDPVREGGPEAPAVPLLVIVSRLAPLTLDQVSISAADVDPAGTLTLTFGALTLTCSSDDAYESWTATSDRGGPVICLPGGELAVFE
ncbi:DUF6188 family protein [Pseudokineococcus sp. 5B2Z-1]|uniref:DUF6188 family protein n=1 Tax=Pseudokineococcus sp. 5B2Z-1 TaxID=3132744 RepID=UPI00309A7EF3